MNNYLNEIKKILYFIICCSSLLLFIDYHNVGVRESIGYFMLLIFSFFVVNNIEAYNYSTLILFSKINISIGILGICFFILKLSEYTSPTRILLSLNNIVLGAYLYYFVKQLN